MNSKHEPMQIAIVEDDAILREELAYFLIQNGFMVHQVNNGSSLDDLMLFEPIKLVILDVGLPGQNGMLIANRLRASFPNLGIIMVTARTALVDRIKGYENGADIYLPKPTPASELLAAVRSLQRRLTEVDSLQSWSLDILRRHITVPGSNQSINLTAMEAILLAALATAQNHTLDFESIQELLAIKYDKSEITKRALENLISRLRKKLFMAIGNEKVRFIQSVWGAGYQLCIPIVISHIEK